MNSPNVNFFGVISDQAFSTIELINPPGTTNDGISIDDITIGSVPEPATMILFGIGVAGIAGYDWRRRKQTATA